MNEMFGDKILNTKELCKKLGISTTLLYRLLDNGLPSHQLTANSRRYYNYDEVEEWLSHAGFHKKVKWTK